MQYIKSQNQKVNEYIENLDPSLVELFLEVRSIILEVDKDLSEDIKWKNCLTYSTSKNIIQTVVGKGKISLIFFEGASFTDQFDLLEGEGNKTRTMRITSADFNKKALKEYTKQAINLSLTK